MFKLKVKKNFSNQFLASNVDWTFLSKTALKDSSVIEVETNVDWQPNDKIVIAGTDFSYVVDYRVTLPSSISWQRGRFEFNF
jgi:hypothetical protein